MGNKNISITIGIPAYNEEQNIALLLDSIILQDLSSIKLELVIIACDNSTDKTASIVREYSKKNRYIKLINSHKRVGQAKRLTNLFKMNKSDIFITFDADTVLANRNVLHEIIKKFNEKSVGLVGGLDIPYTPRSLQEQIIVSGILLWHKVRIDYKYGLNVHNHQGRISALSKSFSKKAFIPANVIANDEFLYFQALKLGYKFNFTRKAIVYYRESTNFKDFFKQSTRFISAKGLVIQYFGRSIEKEYKIPLLKKIKSIVKSFSTDPLYTALGLGSQIILRIVQPFYKENYKGGFWSPAQSTKYVKH